MTDNRRRSESLLSGVRNLLWWIFASLVAITLLQFNPLLGLAAAVIGGVVFGILLFK